RDTYATMSPFAVDPNGGVNVASLKNDLVFFRERGLVGPNVSVEKVVDHSFSEEAVRLLGPYKTRSYDVELDRLFCTRGNRRRLSLLSSASCLTRPAVIEK